MERVALDLSARPAAWTLGGAVLVSVLVVAFLAAGAGGSPWSTFIGLALAGSLGALAWWFAARWPAGALAILALALGTSLVGAVSVTRGSLDSPAPVAFLVTFSVFFSVVSVVALLAGVGLFAGWALIRGTRG